MSSVVFRLRLTHRSTRKIGRALSLHASQLANKDTFYLGFCSMKQLEIFLPSPGWDACLSQGYPPSPALNSPVPISTPGWREALRELNEHIAITPGLQPGSLDPKTSALTMRPPRLYQVREEVDLMNNTHEKITRF